MTALSKVTKAEEIDWTRFVRIGSGSYCDVFAKPNGRFAIKVGRIYDLEVQGLRDAAKVGLATPVYSLIHGVPCDTLPPVVRQCRMRYRNDSEYVSILIVGKAKPYAENGGGCINRGLFKDVDKAVEALYKEARSLGIKWTDDHSGNIGVYRGRAVILDGINWGYAADTDSSSYDSSGSTWHDTDSF